MENYIINNKTIGLLKINNKTIIFNVDKTKVINKSIRQVIDYSCKYYGSNLNGRICSAKYILGDKYKIPIVIDDFNKLILISLSSIRNNICLFLIFNKIVDYSIENRYLKIKCANNVNFYVKISKNIFEKKLLKSLKLNNVLFERKNVKFL